MNEAARLAPAPIATSQGNAARAAAIEAASALAAPLGLCVRSIDVRLDDAAERLLSDRGARGAAMGNVVWLRGFDPRASASRLTLAHELVHVAQSRLASETPASTMAAEREADAIAALLVAGAQPARPRVATGRRLLLDGEPYLATLPLETLVLMNYSSALRQMRELLQAGASSGDVARVLSILAPLDFETARALVGWLAPAHLAIFADGLNEDHARAARREVLAATTRFTPAMLARQRNGLRIFRAMNIATDSLTPPEHRAAVEALRAMPPADLATLDGGDNGPAFRSLRTATLPEYDRDAALDRATDIESRRRGVRTRLTDAEQELYQRLSIMLSRIDRTRAQTALIEIGNAGPLIVADPRYDGSPAPAATAEPAVVPEASLASVIARLDRDGRIAPLIDALHDADRAGTGPVSAGFATLIRVREPHRTMDRLRELLSTGFWDWAVRDWEARLAWDMVRNMPPAEQARFQTLDDGRLYLRLIEELPDDVRNASGMAGLILVRGADGRLADFTGEAGGLLSEHSALIAEFQTRLDERSYELFMALAALAGPVPAPAPERPAGAPLAPPSLDAQRAVVHRLDMLGLISRLFDVLSPGVKQDRRYWNEIAAILGARDPAFNRADLRRLLHTSSFLFISLDSISMEEALFAFHIVRSLPEDQRRAFEQEAGGSLAAGLIGGLSQSMIQEAGLSFAFTRPDARGETPLRRQLADPAAWGAGREADLALLIQMAIAAGDFDWVFDQSRRQTAYAVPALGPVVERFRLYDPRVGRTVTRPHVASAARVSSSLLGMLFGTGGYEVELYTRPVEGVDPMTGEPMTWAEPSGIRMTADLEQLEANSGAALANAAVLARTGGPRVSIGMDNRAAALAQPNVVDLELNETTGVMRLTISQLNLAQLANVSTGATMRTGPVSATNIVFELFFAPGNLREPRRGRFHLDRLVAREIVATEAGNPDPTGLRQLDASGIDADGSFQTSPLPDSPVLGHVFGLLWDLWRNRATLTDRASQHTTLIGATLSIGHIEAQGLRRGDLSLASLTIDGLVVAAGGNRAAHVRAQIRVLDSRIERAREHSPASVPDLIESQAALRTRLATLEPLEAEMLALMARVQAGETLDAAASARLDALQGEGGVGAAGGLSVDIASMAISGLDGPVHIGSASLTNLHGGGESAALAFEQLTSREAISRFVRDGAPTRSRFGAGMADAGMSFTADEMRLNDLSLPATLPTLAEIDAQLTHRPAPSVADRARLNRLRPLIRRYEELRSLSLDNDAAPAHSRTPEDQAELLALTRQLRDEFDIRVAEVVADTPIFSIGESDGMVTGGAIARSITARGIRAAGYSIASVEALHPSGALTLSAESVGDVTAGDLQRGLNARISATQLQIRGIHGPGIADRDGQSITIASPRAVLRMTRDGLRIQDVHVQALTLDALDYNNGTHHFWSTSASVASDITADILLRLRSGAAAEVGNIDYRNIHIEHFRIGRVEGAGLGYERLEGGARRYSINIDSGALLGIGLTDFDIDMTGPETATHGGIVVDGFDQLRFSFAFKQMLEARGQLDRGVTGVPGVHVAMATDGRTTVSLDDLLATDTDVAYRGADGSGGGMRIARGDMSGAIEMAGNDIRLQNLRQQSISFERIRWTTAGGTSIRADGPTVATNVSFTGRYSTLPDERSEFAIDRMIVGRLSGSRIVVETPSMRLELPEPTPDGRIVPGAAATLENIEVSNLLIGLGGAATRIGPIDPARRAHVGITRTSADFFLDYSRELQARGMLQAGQIDLWFDPDGAIEGRAQGLGGAGTLHYAPRTASGAPPPTIGGVDTGFGFSGFDSGLIRYSDNVISIGGRGGTPLHLNDLRLDQLEMHGPSFGVTVPSAGTIMLRDINARIDIHLHPDAAAARAAGTPYRRIVIREFGIGSASAAGMRIHLSSLDMFLDLPEENPLEVGPILAGGLVDPANRQPLEIVPSATGTAITGRVRAEALSAQRLQAQLVGGLNARMNFAADALDLGFAGTGAMRVDLMNWSLTEIRGYVGGNPGLRIGMRSSGVGATSHDVARPGVGGTRLTYDSTGEGTVSLVGTRAQGLRFDDRASGLHLDLREMTLADQDIPLGTNARGERRIVINDAAIADAHIRIDNLADLAGLDDTRPPTAPEHHMLGDATAAAFARNRTLMQALNGHIRGRVIYAAADSPPVDISVDLDIPITAGAIPLQATVQHASTLVSAATSFTFQGNVMTFALDYHLPGGPDGSDPVHVFSPIARWELTSSEITQARAGRLELARLGQTVDPDYRPGAPAVPATPFWSTEVSARPVRFTRLDMGVSLDNSEPVRLDLGSTGWLRFAPNGVQGLSFNGAIAPLSPVAQALNRPRMDELGRTDRPGGLNLGLDSADIEAVNLNFAVGRNLIGLSEGHIEIGALANSRMSFAGIRPGMLDATVRSGRVRGLVVSMTPLVGPPTPATPTPHGDTPGTFRPLDDDGRPTVRRE